MRDATGHEKNSGDNWKMKSLKFNVNVIISDIKTLRENYMENRKWYLI